MLAKMVDLSEQRKEKMATLIKKDPDLAVRVAFDQKAKGILPSEIQVNTEEQVTLEGNLGVSHWDDFERKKGGFYYKLKSNGTGFNLYPSQENVDALISLANEEVKVSGIKIGQEVAVEKVSGEDQVKGAVLGVLDQTILVMVLNNTVSVASAQSVVFSQVSTFYQDNSYGKMRFSGKAAGYTVNLPATCNTSQIYSLATQAATAAGENLAAYRKLMVVFPYMSDCGFSGLATLSSVQGGGTSWINGATNFSLHIVGHELGHNFGALHANYYDCSGVSIKTSGCTSDEYGDWYSIMGGSNNQHNAYHKEKMFFFVSGDSLQVGSSGTYTLSDYYGSSGPKIIKIPRDKTAGGNIINWLYFEYRPELSGVLIHYAPKSASGGDTQLIDASPSTKFPDAQLKVGSVFEDSDKGITVQIASISASQVSLDIQIPTVVGCSRVPPTMVVSPTIAWGEAGSTLNYSVTVTNNDSPECGSSTFSLYYLLQIGFTASFTPNILLSLAPGATSTSTLALTSPASAIVGNIYDAIVTATNGSNSNSFSSKTISYGVLASGGDTVPPTVNITNPTNNQTVSGTVNVGVSATDN